MQWILFKGFFLFEERETNYTPCESLCARMERRRLHIDTHTRISNTVFTHMKGMAITKALSPGNCISTGKHAFLKPETPFHRRNYIATKWGNNTASALTLGKVLLNRINTKNVWDKLPRSCLSRFWEICVFRPMYLQGWWCVWCENEINIVRTYRLRSVCEYT